jgi:hypothetical protein
MGPTDDSGRQRPGKPARRPTRWLLGAALVLVALELVYLVGANLFLGTALGPRLVNRHPEKRTISWRSGHSWLPGMVEIEGFEVTGRQPRLVWSIRVDRATLGIRLPALAARRFHVIWLRGSGVETRMEFLLPPPEERAEEGIPPAGPLAPPPPEAEKFARPPGWTFVFDGVELDDVRELPVGRWRLAGHGRAAGDVSFTIRGPVEVGRGLVEMDDALLAAGDRTLATGLAVAARGRLDPYLPPEHRGRRALAFVSGTLDLAGRTEGLAFLDELFARLPAELELEGSGDLDLHLEVGDGRLAAGSRLALEVPEFAAAFGDDRVAGPARVAGPVEPAPAAGGEPVTTLTADLDRFAVRRAGAGEPHLTGSGMSVRATAGALDLAGKPPHVALHLEVPAAEAPDLTVYNVYLPPAAGLTIAGGSGRLGAVVDLSSETGETRGRIEVAGHDVTVRYERLAAAGDVTLLTRFAATAGALPWIERAELTLRSGTLAAGGRTVARRVDAELDLSLPPAAGPPPTGREVLGQLSGTARLAADVESLGFLDGLIARAPWLGLAGSGRLETDLRLDSGKLQPGSRLTAAVPALVADYLDYRVSGAARIEGLFEEGAAGRGRLAATFDRFELHRAGQSAAYLQGTGFSLVATVPGLDLGAPPPDFDLTIDLPSSEVPHLAVYNDLLPPAAGFGFDRGAGRLGAHFELSTRAGAGGGGTVELAGDGVAAHFEELGLTGGFALHARLAAADLEARRFGVAGTRLELERVAVVGRPPDPEGPWWARVELTSGRVDLRTPLEVDSVGLSFAMRDSAPLVALFGEKKSVIKLAAPLLEVEDVSGGAVLSIAGGRFELRRVEIGSDRLELEADLCFGPRQKRGLFYASRGRLRAAAELRDGERDWKFLRAREWYEEKVRAGIHCG